MVDDCSVASFKSVACTVPMGAHLSDHKNQHFVPRCHLKPFTIGGDGKAINLYNIRRNVFVDGAPIKGQCAKNFFYGEDLVIEKELQLIEGSYARVIAGLSARQRVTDSDLALLRAFAYLQHLRTDVAAKRAGHFREGSQNAAYEGTGIPKPEIDLSERSLIKFSLLMFARSNEQVDDLKICLLENETFIEFVTSDNPTILVNKFHEQKLSRKIFGIGSSGVILFLPLTPRLQLMCYDGDIYTVPGKSLNRIRVRSSKDIRAINRLQFLWADKNIYFSNLTQKNLILEDIALTKRTEIADQIRFSTFVPDGQPIEGVERHKRATREEIEKAKRKMVVFEVVYPTPASWPSLLKYRESPRTYSNGSAIGHIRKAIVPIVIKRSHERRTAEPDE